MNSEKYLTDMIKIQQKLLDYFDEEVNIQEKYQSIEKIFNKISIHDNRNELKSFLHLLLKISNNYHRNINFFSKIEQIFLFFKNEIKRYFTNSEIFNIFKSNKRVLLLLIENNLMHFDQYIVKQIIQSKFLNANYPQYFALEIHPFINEKWFPKNDIGLESHENIKKVLADDFYENRKIGENEDLICKLIQKDSIEEFDIYITRNSYSLRSIINTSIYETNNFLIRNKKTSLIEYSVFYGSIQIFNYLRFNGVELKPKLWKYAIHGKNADIIHLLEENHVNPPNKEYYNEIFKESIKCHHIDIAHYIQVKYLVNGYEDSNDALINNLKYYNFSFIQKNFNNELIFYYLCKYDYYILAINCKY